MKDDAKAIRTSLTAAFKELRREGYFCRQNFLCCQSCGFAEAEKRGATNSIVFYHGQDADYLRETGECWLAWRGDGADIVRVLETHGLDAEWDGDDKTRILVRAA